MNGSATVGDIQVALRIEGKTPGSDLRAGGRAAVPREADDSGPATVVMTPAGVTMRTLPAIGDVEIPGSVEFEAEWAPELRLNCGDAIATMALVARTGEGGDDARWRDLAHAEVTDVGDVDVTRLVDRDSGRVVELRARGRTLVAAELRVARAGIVLMIPAGLTRRMRLLPVSAI